MGFWFADVEDAEDGHDARVFVEGGVDDRAAGEHPVVFFVDGGATG